MRKVYVLYGWTPIDGRYVSGIYTSLEKAKHAKIVRELQRHGEARIYNIETEVLQ